MEQQSGNNFDTLFQRAAEDYPLKTDNCNWEIVATKLHSVGIIALPASKNRRWQYVAIILLLLLASSYIYFTNRPTISTEQSAGNQSKIASKKYLELAGNNSQNKKVITDKNFQNQPKNSKSKNNFVSSLSNNLVSNNNSISNTQVYKLKELAINNKNEIGKSTDVNDNMVSEQQNIIVDNSPLRAFVNNSNTEIKTVNEEDNKNTAQLHSESAKTEENKNIKPDESKSIESQHIKLAPQPKLLYGELFVAPDFSTVKLQNVNAPGYNAGIAIGYKLSKRFSAELGLERLHTDFYSNAKYLDKSHLKLKPNTTVQFVNGKSKLTEVPFDLKYNLSKKNDHFFVTMGTTLARITHTEKYNYRVIKDGTQHEASKHFGALTGTEFFSDVNLSAGYQTKLSGSFSLKAEPYYQIPLKGLGVGNLPVTNFGVSIGIIKDLK